jgi:type IV pilus assembly protein PilF
VKRLVSTVAGAALALRLSGCATAPRRETEQSQIRYQLAADYFRGRRIEAAQAELQRALQLDPENADAHNLGGLMALEQGADSIRQAETAGCLTGADALAVGRDAASKFKEAEQWFRKATTLRPDFAEAWNNLSVAALHLDAYDEAASAAENALRDVAYASPELARANLGWAEYHKGDLNAAWKALHQAVSGAPGFCVGRYRLAKVYTDRGQLDEAAEQLDSVAADGACPIQEAFLLAGLVQRRRKDLPKARGMFDRCVQVAPRACLAAECRQYAEMLQ